MAIKFKLIQKRDMKGGKKFYPQVITNGNVTFTKLCQALIWYVQIVHLVRANFVTRKTGI